MTELIELIQSKPDWQRKIQTATIIKTTEGLCIVFPNFMQHRVSGFKLKDPTRTRGGTRKILVFFLVDPTTRVISTKDVEPQQTLMTKEEALYYRELLMFQRKYEIGKQTDFFEREWSMCEH